MSKVCVVIGGTGALGRACAEDLAANGFKIVVGGRNKNIGDDVVKAIKSKGGEAAFLPIDLNDHDSVKKFHKDAVSTYGRLDAAVNGGGMMGSLAKLGDNTDENITNTLHTNLTSVIWCMQEQVRAMLANPSGSSGRIVNFSSIYGLHGVKFGSIYSTTKHGLIGLTKSAALDYAKDNILINAVAPGLIMTELTKALDPTQMPEGELKDEMLSLPSKYPQGKFGEVEDVARGVRYLIESPWTTGIVLEMDGGFGAT